MHPSITRIRDALSPWTEPSTIKSVVTQWRIEYGWPSLNLEYLGEASPCNFSKSRRNCKCRDAWMYVEFYMMTLQQATHLVSGGTHCKDMKRQCKIIILPPMMGGLWWSWVSSVSPLSIFATDGNRYYNALHCNRHHHRHGIMGSSRMNEWVPTKKRRNARHSVLMSRRSLGKLSRAKRTFTCSTFERPWQWCTWVMEKIGEFTRNIYVVPHIGSG